MADKKQMSVEEILAECRRQDGSGGAEPPPSEPPETSSQAAEQPAPAAPAGPKKPAQAMSVEEMLAAARGEKAKGDAEAAEAKTGEAEEAAAASEKAAPEAAKKPAAKKPGAMSMEEMLAAARAEKSKPAAKATPKESPKPKPATKPAQEAGKPAAKAAAPGKPPAKTGGPRDTASILAAARKAEKRGPLSKAEAAARAKEQPQSKPAAKPKPKPVVPPMPAKPDYAKATEPGPQEQETRRGFFASMAAITMGSALAIGLTSLVLTNLLWLLGFARFMFPNILIEPPTRFTVGFPTDISSGMVETRFLAEFGIWVVNYEYDGQPQIFALQAICTHLGCTPNWLEGEQKFKCPCHGSGFYKDGINFEGPAPRPLERYAIRIADDGQLEVDKSQTFQEELGQWRDPNSFVPA